MIDYRLCGIITVVAFIMFLVVLTKLLALEEEAPLLLYVFFCITMAVWFCGIASLYDVFGDNPNSFVNPSITTTQYEVTQIKTNLDSDEKTYELTSEQGDKETLSSEQYDNLSKGDTLLKKQYTAKKVQRWLAYRLGNFETIEWFLSE
ncbi:hypothetical protein SAMN04487839_1236 [Streptococcus gallolyticus]|uniref:Uncharacterized protein n=1 Tax=Streptococcus gallolyticus TaxID=315405 RepID=A0A1H7Y233_9STRE|nr:hypothetical protein [Streptococcus gallolyticus]SEF25612.1 hypothetical protein SAMN02910295_0247 [Streptococcus gallolyticus]SEM39397.1 hypothetical protein SAMN04487839_1236 [Streptococcus gallolyticus]